MTKRITSKYPPLPGEGDGAAPVGAKPYKKPPRGMASGSKAP